jgi:hypothetical protein
LVNKFVIKEIVGADKKPRYYIECVGHQITNHVTERDKAEEMLKKQIEFGDGRFRNSWDLLES